MDFIKNILSRGLPKTGQTIEHLAGDDGTTEIGWWLRLLNANNRTRLITKTVNGDVIVFDRTTGLCWVGDGDGGGCNDGNRLTWVDGIAFAAALDFAEYTDWRVPNIFELQSLLNAGLFDPAIVEPPFSNTKSDKYWSSTTRVDLTTYCWVHDFTNFYTNAQDKTNTYYLRCVRGVI